MKKLMGDQDHIGENLRAYMQAFSPAVRDIFESFDFHTQIDRLAKSSLLYLVTEKFANIDLHPETIDNAQMGAVFEEGSIDMAHVKKETENRGALRWIAGLSGRLLVIAGLLSILASNAFADGCGNWYNACDSYCLSQWEPCMAEYNDSGICISLQNQCRSMCSATVCLSRMSLKANRGRGPC